MFSFLTNKLYDIYQKMQGITSLNEENLAPFLKMIKNTLIESDVSFEVVNGIIESLKNRVIDVKIPKQILAGEYLAKEFYTIILHKLKSNKSKKDSFHELINDISKTDQPLIIFLVGLQGAGKTTTVGKIIHLLRTQKIKKIQQADIGVISLDYDRPAAAEQLKLVAQGSDVEYISLSKTTNSIEAAQELKKNIKNKSIDKKIIIVDTAGRLVFETTMMEELKKLYEILTPKEVFLVIDIMISQEGVNVARAFVDAIPCSGCIITKVDSEAPGGIILSITSLLSLPILYLTFGEKQQHIQEFDPATIAKKLIGMGEISSLVKSAEEKIAKEEEKILEEAFKRGDITIDEFARLIELLSKMGPLKHIVSMIPRSMLGGAEINNSTFSQIELFNKRIVIMSSSMTKKERRVPALLLNNNQRIKRISKGCGISLSDIEASLHLFFKMRTAFNSFKHFLK